MRSLYAIKGTINMRIDAIVYTSNTGYTKEHATLLAKKLELPVYSLDEAQKNLPKQSTIIYLGWLMASTVQGYKSAAKLYNIAVLCAVCLGPSGSLLDEVKKVNKIPESLPLFTLQGGFDMERLHGIYKFIMKIVKKALIKEIEGKDAKNEEDENLLKLLEHGGSAVRAEDHAPIIELVCSSN